MIAILGKKGPPDAALAHTMLAAAPHRGSSHTVRTIGNCVLGIANQPGRADATISSDGPVMAVLLGRLDNGADLHRALMDSAAPPASSSDGDVVVAAFRVYGVDAPNRLRGAFAGIVSDGRTLWCFRDHVGFRPLFYRDEPRLFVAAIEPRQVIAGTRISEEPDLDVLEQMFFGRMPADAPASLKGVARLAQATTLTVRADTTIARHEYWRPVELLESARLRPGDIRDRFLQVFEQATVRSLTGKDAILLSGGVDSPAVAAFAAPECRRRTGRPLGALSAVFPDLPAVDERHYIELVAQRFGIELHTYRPQARALDNVDQWCRLFASPVPILSIPEVADAYSRVRQLGYENVLSGEFAEFVVGSPIHAVQHLFTRGRWRAMLTLLRTESRRGASDRHIAALVGAAFVPGSVANAYLRWRRLDSPERIPVWLDARKVNEEPFRGDLTPPSWQRWRNLQLDGTTGGTISIEADETTAALSGVTIRRPFADIDLWEFFLSLPAETKIPDLRFKTLLRTMLRGVVPDEILDRKRKTLFDDHVMKQVDYPTLTRLLVEPRHRVPWVDYGRLATQIREQNFNRFDWFWAKDLAGIHAFLNAW